ncbi:MULTISPECIES: flagellar hook-length control protein FliK [unclassified Paenibacillus]|uniref:flagellar hook-length control protein FliK n=1 Tax=unclassified Paenibacillus TaxID=185978 RepID=UPI00363DEDCF
MEIQAQVSVTPTASVSSNASNNANGSTSAAPALSGQAKTGFSATLNSMLAGEADVSQGDSQISLVGLNVLAQLMAALKEDSTVLPEQGLGDSLKQLDDLINLMDSDTDFASAFMDDPGVQAWLAQIQALLQLQTPAALSVTPNQTSETGEATVDEAIQPSNGNAQNSRLNPLLFVPLETSSTDNETAQTVPVADLKPVTKAEAHKLLESFKNLLQSNSDQNSNLLTGNSLQKIVADLQQVLAPLVAAPAVSDNSKDSVTDSEVATQLFSTQTNDRSPGVSTVTNPIKRDIAFQVNVTAVNPKLEFLAARALPPKTTVEEVVNDAPLFEPLQEMVVDTTADNSVMPMHEFLKQVQSGEQLTKTPVLLMHSHSFTEDMTDFVKAFTLDARADGITEAKLSLYPQHLGQVDVKLTIHNGQLIAQFMADSLTGKEMLESQLSQLRATLQSQGIQVDKLEVTQSQSFQSGMFQEQRQQQSQQSNKQQKGNGTNKALSLDEELTQAAAKTAPVSNRLGQTSIDTTA